MIEHNMVGYNDLVNLQDSPLKFEFLNFVNHENGGRGLKFVDHPFPWSISEIEYRFLHDTIIENKLIRGIDLCTGIGMSALSAAFAMKKTGGKVVTIDAYVEEYYNYFEYKSKKVIQEADGYININYLRKKFNLEEELIPEVGWSPDDVPKIIERNFSETIDYVFIDGGHTEDQLYKDITAIYPYTDDKTVWLFHDCVDTLWTRKISAYCAKNMNSYLEIKCPKEAGCHELGILVKFEE